MVLLAGDLFHDNKPSRKALYQVMRSLRMNCLGEKPCELEMLSDAGDIFEGAFNHVNYEDEDINIAIPVFSIHGNHDDPSGDGHFCSLDLLQVSGLLNYIGRTPESDNIQVKPVLLQKGQTKLALYGMSNVRDERLFRTFRDGKVKFFNPSVQKNDWFNIMAVHQNHHAHTETSYLPENFLPEFLDLVVWGHEHECLIDPRLNPETGFRVMQPGSSVATSLVPGEAVPKHVAVVSVTGKDFKVTSHRIKSVRPFITKEIALANETTFRSLDKQKDNKDEVTKRLMVIVEEMIEQAKHEWLAIQDEAEGEIEIPLPLVRLKVEYSSVDNGRFDIENPQRFSNRFIGKVANQNDVIVFHRKKKGTPKDKLTSIAQPDESAVVSMTTIDTVKIDKLVHEFLEAQTLKILPRGQFGDAVTQFVDKDDKHAMEEFVAASLDGQVKQLLDLDIDEDEIDNQMEAYKEKAEKSYLADPRRIKSTRKLKPRPVDWDTEDDGEWENDPAAWIYEVSRDSEEPAAPARGRRTAAVSDDESVFGGPPARTVPAKRAPAKKAPVKKAPPKRVPAKAPARGRGKKAAEPSDDDLEEESDVMMLDEPPPPARSQPKRAAITRSSGRQTQLSFTQGIAKSQAQKEPSPDEISDDDDDAFEPLRGRH